MSNPTDTNQASEPYELCKGVYERTEWEDDLDHFDAGDTPIYTSDYLLEKIPSRIQDDNGNYFSLMGFPNGIQPWFAYKGGMGGEDSRWPIDKGIPYYQRVFQADTPLKALLKLTIALSEAGELK